ncbi:hypothetical protein [Streptosporangium canum]|uniref:hypothetical protein n=1 Tax=Streptosporangium canum TaxID=324952 RepID=UPI00342BE8DA
MRKIRTALATAGLAAALTVIATSSPASAATGSTVSAADAAQASACSVSGTASYYSTTVVVNGVYYRVPYAQAHIDSNSCGSRFRAYIVCDTGLGTYWRYGEERTGAGSSNAWSTTTACGPHTSGRQKGYQVYSGGKWNTYPR